MKDLEGKTVYMAPTGNNARYNAEYITAEIIKVSRVNVTLRREGGHFDENMRMNVYFPRRLEEGCNSGWTVYGSLVEMASANRVVKLNQDISSMCEWSNNVLGLVPLSDLEKINSILMEAKDNAQHK